MVAFKEIRLTSSYTSTPPGEPHREGGGDEGAVVFYWVRAGAGEVLFKVLDDKLKVVGTLNMADFEGALEDQKNSEANRLEAGQARLDH